MARLKTIGWQQTSKSSVIFSLNFKPHQFAIYINLDPEHDGLTTHVAVLDILLAAGRGVDPGLERLPAVRALDALLAGHGLQSNSL